MVRTPSVRDVPDMATTRHRVLVGSKRPWRDIGRHPGSTTWLTQWHNGPDGRDDHTNAVLRERNPLPARL